MMVLYHLHNPDAPKFVPSCALCHKEVIQGYRHSCPTCAVDFCHSCYSVHGPRLPTAPVASYPGEWRSSCAAYGGAASRAAQHPAALGAASSRVPCNSTTCTSRNCQKMKDFLKHENTCQIKAQRGCRHCIQMNKLLQLRALVQAGQVRRAQVPRDPRAHPPDDSPPAVDG